MQLLASIQQTSGSIRLYGLRNPRR